MSTTAGYHRERGGVEYRRERGRVKSSARVFFFLVVGYKEAEIWT